MAQANKFIAAIVGAIAAAIAQGILPEDVNKYVVVAVVFLTAIGVYAVPNKPSTL